MLPWEKGQQHERMRCPESPAPFLLTLYLYLSFLSSSLEISDPLQHLTSGPVVACLYFINNFPIIRLLLFYPGTASQPTPEGDVSQ